MYNCSKSYFRYEHDDNLKDYFRVNSLDGKICLWVVINSCVFEYRLTNNHCKRNNHCWAAKTP